MGWFRVDDRLPDHPKFLELSDGAFRLWVEAGCYCNRHLTDGLVLRVALNGFRHMTRKRVDELVRLHLWEADTEGFRFHDYHQWNDPAEVVKEKRRLGRERTRRWRGDAVSDAPSVTRYTSTSRDAHTPCGVGISGSSKSSEYEDPRRDPFTDSSVTERAGRFIERYEALYQQHRQARYMVRPQRDYQAAVQICATWTDDTRLDKIAAIFLTTDHEFAEKGSRTIPQFAALASWADSKLSEWERKQQGVA